MNRQDRRLLFLLGILILGVVINIFTNSGIFKNDSEVVGDKVVIIDNKEDELNSKNAILIRLDDNQVLYTKNESEKIYPASMTKIMSVLIGIESLDKEEKILLDDDLFDTLYEKNASLAGFKPGEKVLVEDLLYASILPSGTEAVMGIVKEVAGSEEEFVKLMNKRGKELGMNNTNFVNASGLHDENHYSTVEDISKLFKFALENDKFREIVTSKSYRSHGTKYHPLGLPLESTLYTKANHLNFKNGSILGGKTGFTDDAGLCLASIAEKGEQEFILISANAPGKHYTDQYHILDAILAYDLYAVEG